MSHNKLVSFLICSAAALILSSDAALVKVCPGKPADIVFVLDESSSIWPVHFDKLKRFIANLTENFNVGPDQTRFAVITYADYVTKRFGFSDFADEQEVSSAIMNIKQQTGGTKTDEALRFVRKSIFTASEREGVPKIAVLVTDGASWYPKRTAMEAKLLQESDVTIFVVAISNQINWKEINTIASNPDEQHVFSVSSFDDLGITLVNKLVQSTCEVQGNPVGVCNINFMTDVVFVLASASQNPEGANQALSLIQSVVADKNTFVGPQSLRFGLLPTVCQQDYGFPLNKYDEKDEILLHLERKKSYLTPADHIDRLVTEAFTPESGDRPGVKNLAVVIMDRKSPDFIKTIEASNRAKKAGIEIVVVAVGKEVDDAEVTFIASDPVSQYKITLSDYTEVVDLKHKFYSLVCP